MCLLLKQAPDAPLLTALIRAGSRTFFTAKHTRLQLGGQGPYSTSGPHTQSFV
ncbi:hypothetical protein ACJBU6_09795 [Exserohilum turcicum]